MRLLYWRQLLTLPPPLAFSLRASLIMLGLLAFLPHTDLSVPIAIGGGLSLALVL